MRTRTLEMYGKAGVYMDDCNYTYLKGTNNFNKSMETTLPYHGQIIKI